MTAKSLRAQVMHLLSDGEPHEFPEIHARLGAGRLKTATRAILQDLKNGGLLTVAPVTYSKVMVAE